MSFKDSPLRKRGSIILNSVNTVSLEHEQQAHNQQPPVSSAPTDQEEPARDPTGRVHTPTAPAPAVVPAPTWEAWTARPAPRCGHWGVTRGWECIPALSLCSRPSLSASQSKQSRKDQGDGDLGSPCLQGRPMWVEGGAGPGGRRGSELRCPASCL